MNVVDAPEMLRASAQLLEILNASNERLQSEVYRLRQAVTSLAAAEAGAPGVTVEAAAKLAEERDAARKALETLREELAQSHFIVRTDGPRTIYIYGHARIEVTA